MILLFIYYGVFPFLVALAPLVLFALARFQKNKRAQKALYLVALVSLVGDASILFKVFLFKKFDGDVPKRSGPALVEFIKTTMDTVEDFKDKKLAVDEKYCNEDCQKEIAAKDLASRVTIVNMDNRDEVKPCDSYTYDGGGTYTLTDEPPSRLSATFVFGGYCCGKGYLCLTGASTFHSMSEFNEVIYSLFQIKPENTLR